MGIAYTGVSNVFNSLITDLHRKKAGAAIAASWFVRCLFSAAVTAAIEPMILAVGSGWSYASLGSLHRFLAGLDTNYV